MQGRDWIVGKLGAPAFERLATELSGSELQSVLLEVMHHRAKRRGPAEIVAQHARDVFCRPASVDQRTAIAIDGHLLAAAEGFDAIELSPVAPLGACSAVALTDQNRVLSALRGTEIVSDPTNVLALECALRMRADPGASVHLATSQRVIRAQPVPKLPGYASHFRIFVLASAGNEGKEHSFTVETMVRHVRTMLGCLDRLEQNGYSFGARRVDVLATAKRAQVGDRVADGLGGIATRKALEHAYYSLGLRYMLWVTAPDGSQVPLVDGGAFDWVAKLSSNRRAVFVATGAGAQLIPIRFRAGERTPAPG
jgi:hypothetical protein